MTNLANHSFLTALGLSEHESKVYTTLLTYSSASPTVLEKKTKLHRPLVYQALESLKAKNLIKIIPKGKRKVYRAESPDALVTLFQNLEKNFTDGIEDLHTLHATQKGDQPKVTYTEGDPAIRDNATEILEDTPFKGTYYCYRPGYNLYDEKRFLPRGYRALRDRKQLERYIIVNDDGKKHINARLGKYVKAVPRSFDLFNDRIHTVIYGDKISLIDYENPSVITITHPPLAKFQTKLFKFLFSKL